MELPVFTRFLYLTQINAPMKKTALLFLFTILLFSCKRKQELTTPEGTLVTTTPTCFNGMQDSTETGIDCGGPCTACNVIVPTCTPTANTLTVGSSTSAATGTSCGISGGYFTMSGNYGSGSYTIQINAASPNLTTAYNQQVSGSPFYSNDVSVQVTHWSYGTMYLTSGTVYFSQVGGKYVATICNGSAWSWSMSSSYNVTGNVSCP
jgi:hypothetical protein